MDPRTERAVQTWSERDARRAIHVRDRAAIEATEAARALVLDRLTGPPLDTHDLFSACARLGRLLAEAGASPSLAVTSLDGAAEALSSEGLAYDEVALSPARAALAEGYFAALVEAERAAAARAWEYPACATRVDDQTVAITAGVPLDDPDGLAEWAARVAARVARAGVRRAIVSGPELARTELEDALALVGVELLTELPARRGFRLPWRR